MAESTFKPGDLVELKSGSPKMTVESSNASVTVCYWYNQHTFDIEKRNFPTVILTPNHAYKGAAREDEYEVYNEDE